MTSDSSHGENSHSDSPKEGAIDLVELSVDDPSISMSIQPVKLQDSEAVLPPPLPPVAVTKDTSETKIDLGEDLLDEKTVIIAGLPGEPEAQIDPRAVEATVQNARILLSEGFPEEAKKILRQILLKNKNNVESQKLLEEIHHSELKQIFTAREPNTRKNYTAEKNIYDESILNVDAEKLLKSMDEEFDLNFDPSQGGDIFVANEFDTVAPGPTDRIDLAISFIEMELYAHANQLLRAVLRTENNSTLIAVSLLAHSHLLSGQYYEVISILQPYINDIEISKEDKIEFFYYMGRANSALQRSSEAIGWFLHVETIDPSYRDTANWLRQLKK